MRHFVEIKFIITELLIYSTTVQVQVVVYNKVTSWLKLFFVALKHYAVNPTAVSLLCQ